MKFMLVAILLATAVVGVGYFLETRAAACIQLEERCERATETGDIFTVAQCSFISLTTREKTESLCKRLLQKLGDR